MRRTPTSPRSIAALALGLALVASACGGGGSSDDAATGDDAGTTTTTASSGTPDQTLPPYEAPKAEFSEVDGSRARFVNLVVVDGKGTDIDVYWGYDAETGKKAATVGYGEVSDWMPIEVSSSALTGDGSDPSSQVAFYPKGETDRESLLMTENETIDGDVSFTYAVGWQKTSDASQSPATVGLGYDHDAVAAPDGKAWVALSTIGVGGVEGGDFMTLNSAAGCQDLTETDLGGGTANAGLPIVLDPGSTEITASDANSDCATKTPPLSLDLAAGDRYVVFAYGADKESRKLLAVKVDD